MVIRLHMHTSPNERLGRKALLHTRSQHEVLFKFFLALFELLVGRAKAFFGALLVGNIDECDDCEAAAVLIFTRPRADDDGEPAAVVARQYELKTVMACPHTLLSLVVECFGFLRSEKPIEVRADKLAARNSGHFLEIFVGEDDLGAIVRNDHAFIQRLKDTFDLRQPLGRFEFHEIPFASILPKHPKTTNASMRFTGSRK